MMLMLLILLLVGKVIFMGRLDICYLVSICLLNLGSFLIGIIIRVVISVFNRRLLEVAFKGQVLIFCDVLVLGEQTLYSWITFSCWCRLYL